MTPAQLDAHTAEFERGEQLHFAQEDAKRIEDDDMKRSGCGIYKAPPVHVQRTQEFDHAVRSRNFNHRFEFTYLGNWKHGVQRDKTMFDVFINAMDNDEIAAKVIRAVIHCAAAGDAHAQAACDAVRGHFIGVETNANH